MHEQDEAKLSPEERATMLGGLPPDAKLLIIGPGGKIVREIKRDADGKVDGPVDLEPGQSIAVLSVSVRRVQRPPLSWQRRTRFIATNLLALAAIVYILALLLPQPWWLTVGDALVVTVALLVRSYWRWRARSAPDDEDDQRDDREDHE